jgi:hypothetical protein
MKQPLFILLLVAASACSATDEARVSVQYVPRMGVAALTPSVVVTAPGLKQTLSSAQVGVSSLSEVLEIATPTTGRLDIEYSLVSGATTASTGTVHADLRPDWTWGFRISVDSVSPLRGCFGCVGAQAFPLNAAYRRGPADSVWVSWGGNSIKHPVVY